MHSNNGKFAFWKTHNIDNIGLFIKLGKTKIKNKFLKYICKESSDFCFLLILGKIKVCECYLYKVDLGDFFSLGGKRKMRGIEVIYERGRAHSFFTQNTGNEPTQVDSCPSAELCSLLSLLLENIHHTLSFQNFELFSSVGWGCSDVRAAVWERALEYKGVKLAPGLAFSGCPEKEEPGFILAPVSPSAARWPTSTELYGH